MGAVREARQEGRSKNADASDLPRLSPLCGGIASPPLEPALPAEDSTLVIDLQDVVHAAAELANVRFAKIVSARAEMHACLALADLVDLCDLSWAFIVQCEVICTRMVVGLRGVLMSQSKSWLAHFHQRQITMMAGLVENEQWVAADISTQTQETVSLILVSAVSDPPAFCLGVRRQGAQEVSPEAGSSKQVAIEGLNFFAVAAGASALVALGEYTRVVINCPSLTTDVLSKLVEYMKVC